MYWNGQGLFRSCSFGASSIFRFTNENGGRDGLRKVAATFDNRLSYGGRVASYDRTPKVQRLLGVAAAIGWRSHFQADAPVEWYLDASAHPTAKQTTNCWLQVQAHFFHAGCVAGDQTLSQGTGTPHQDVVDTERVRSATICAQSGRRAQGNVRTVRQRKRVRLLRHWFGAVATTTLLADVDVRPTTAVVTLKSLLRRERTRADQITV